MTSTRGGGGGRETTAITGKETDGPLTWTRGGVTVQALNIKSVAAKSAEQRGDAFILFYLG